jgi:thiamine biosynthesis lipoprotein ApbE
MTARNMSRRSFLKLPVFFHLGTFGAAWRSREYHFQYEGVIGTSLDLIVWTSRSSVAECVCSSILGEIGRLASILDTRDARSEISRLNSDSSHTPSYELKEVLDAYEYWGRRSGGILSIRSGGANMPLNVDALGKAYIIDRVSELARTSRPSIDGLLLNIGGDIVVSGRRCSIGIANPVHSYDNAPPIATIDLENAAVATSGTYARGAHLKDPRYGQSLIAAAATTVVAPDAVTANALATMLCIAGNSDHAFRLVESTPGAEALRILSGVAERTSGFARLEEPWPIQTPAPAQWPAGYRLTVTLPLTAGRSTKRPYVAVWVEDASGKLVRSLALWGNKSKYFPDLSAAWNLTRGNQKQFHSVTRATRPPGKYELVWEGVDNENKPVPPGTYRITVETNQERGTYAKQAGTIVLGDTPASVTLPATANFDPVLVQYGPK